MDVSDSDLLKAIRSAARVVDRYGERYWPLFERLEAELDARQSRAARIKAHLNPPPQNRSFSDPGTSLAEQDAQSSEAHRA